MNDPFFLFRSIYGPVWFRRSAIIGIEPIDEKSCRILPSRPLQQHSIWSNVTVFESAVDVIQRFDTLQIQPTQILPLDDLLHY